jgi:hypothetical protein
MDVKVWVQILIVIYFLAVYIAKHVSNLTSFNFYETINCIVAFL